MLPFVVLYFVVVVASKDCHISAKNWDATEERPQNVNSYGISICRVMAWFLEMAEEALVPLRVIFKSRGPSAQKKREKNTCTHLTVPTAVIPRIFRVVS